ncbi:protein I'm not dead yet-like isoform X1 [Schistocerca piceifrons]|uniref:protein I'm not dead yet-like isoform X1 n=1 Tax=Schistocerca piceifrons TaxID=274613 RepID=UPI001F5F0724|nr:protein I'm not dead yet-like isoform X1 [Schistocerca piceifrons]
MRPLLGWLSARWRSIIVLVWPLALLPLAVSPYSEARCGYVVLVMALFWITEAAPLPVTSLLPVVLFPLLGILSTDDVCIQYLKETNMMFIGGLIIAISVEHCNLHKRIALRAILVIGTSPGRLLFGLMGTTMFVSMWISNTAATAMVTPIAKAVLAELKAHEKAEKRSAILAIDEAFAEYTQETTGKETKQDSPEDEEEETPDKEAVGYFLGICYAATLGGTGTLIGTGTNLIFKGIFASEFPNGENITFAGWMMFCVPLMLLCTLAGWLWLMILYMGLFRRKKSGSAVKTAEQRKAVKLVIKKSYQDLGPMTFHEGSVLFFFIVIVLLWFFREPEFMPGWAAAVSDVEVQDSTAVMLVCFLLFVLPADLDFLKFRFNADKPCKPSPSLITWKVVEKKMHWGIILLLGGGFAMAEATNASGLNDLIGDTLSVLNVLPDLAILIIVCIATTFLTQFASNAAICNIVLPVLAKMAVAVEIHPMYLMMPACLCCSYAYVLPVGTPPNAFVMGECNMKTSDMIKAGLGMCVISIVFLLVLFPTYGGVLYGLNGFPSWAANSNTTKSFHQL